MTFRNRGARHPVLGEYSTREYIPIEEEAY